MTSAVTGARNTCPECGSYSFTRYDEATRAYRTAEVTIWEDNTVTPDEDSPDWDVDEATFGRWECSNGHPVTDEALANLFDRAFDEGDQIDLP